MVHRETLPTPSIDAGKAVWTSYGETIIKAPAREVYHALRDFQSYSKWNKYTPSMATPSGTNEIQLNDVVTVAYRAGINENLNSIPCKVTAVSYDAMSFAIRALLPYIPEWMLVPEKVHKVTMRDAGECMYQVYETKSGLLAYAVKYCMGAKQSRMNQNIADALKVYVEEGGKGNDRLRI